MHRLLNVSVEDRIEFNSAEPKFYEEIKGHEDKPRGYGAPATFHYVKVRAVVGQRADVGDVGDGAGLFSCERRAMPARRLVTRQRPPQAARTHPLPTAFVSRPWQNYEDWMVLHHLTSWAGPSGWVPKVQGAKAT